MYPLSHLFGLVGFRPWLHFRFQLPAGRTPGGSWSWPPVTGPFHLPKETWIDFQAASSGSCCRHWESELADERVTCLFLSLFQTNNKKYF